MDLYEDEAASDLLTLDMIALRFKKRMRERVFGLVPHVPSPTE